MVVSIVFLCTYLYPKKNFFFLAKSIFTQLAISFHRAGDRSFWDGWSSKAMFMKGNGQFTRKNVRSQVGESVCITVLVRLYIKECLLIKSSSKQLPLFLTYIYI